MINLDAREEGQYLNQSKLNLSLRTFMFQVKTLRKKIEQKGSQTRKSFHPRNHNKSKTFSVLETRLRVETSSVKQI